MEFNTIIAGHESHRLVWACLALIGSIVVLLSLFISLSSPWYYIDTTNHKNYDEYISVRWEGIKVETDDGRAYSFTQWNSKELDGTHTDRVASIFGATEAFMVMTCLCAIFMVVPIIVLVVPVPGDYECGFFTLQYSLSSLRLASSLCAMFTCGCVCFCLTMAWFIFFGVTDAFNHSDLCDRGATPDLRKGPCKHFSGEFSDIPYGPSAGWVFAFFTFCYVSCLCLCLIMTAVSEGASLPNKVLRTGYSSSNNDDTTGGYQAVPEPSVDVESTEISPAPVKYHHDDDEEDSSPYDVPVTVEVDHSATMASASGGEEVASDYGALS